MLDICTYCGNADYCPIPDDDEGDIMYCHYRDMFVDYDHTCHKFIDEEYGILSETGNFTI